MLTDGRRGFEKIGKRVTSLFKENFLLFVKFLGDFLDAERRFKLHHGGIGVSV